MPAALKMMRGKVTETIRNGGYASDLDQEAVLSLDLRPVQGPGDSTNVVLAGDC